MSTVRFNFNNYGTNAPQGYAYGAKVRFSVDTRVTGGWAYNGFSTPISIRFWIHDVATRGEVAYGINWSVPSGWGLIGLPTVVLTANRDYYITNDSYAIDYTSDAQISAAGITMSAIHYNGGIGRTIWYGGIGGVPDGAYDTNQGLAIGVEAEAANRIPNPPASIRINGNTADWQWVRSNPQLAWNFSDPDGGNYQAYYHVQRCDSRGWGYVDYDTGGINTGNNWHDFSWSNQGTNYARVRTADQAGAWGDWSYITYQYDDGVPYANNGYSETPNTNTSSTFRVVITGVGDGVSGVSIVRFPTRVVNQTDFVWLDGWNAGGGTWVCDISVPNTFGNRDGQYETHIYLYDVAGNGKMQNAVYTNVDRTKPSDPNPVISSSTAVSVTLSWNGFSDPGFSSGWRSTDLYFGEWNGSGWVSLIHNGTNIGNTTSYSIGNLQQGKLYRYTVTYHDNANNESYYTYKTFTTNTLGTSSITNLTANGYLVNQRPKFRAAWSDPNGDVGTLRIQISNYSNFSNLLVDAIADQAANNAGWQTKAGTTNGGVNFYTPQVDLGSGTRYARVQSWDSGGNMWANWSGTYMFAIRAPVWTDTINATATGVKKVWIDQLRSEINAIRQARGLAVSTWTDPEISANMSMVKAVHLTQLRTSIAAVADVMGVSYSWTDPAITANTTERKGQHWKELRDLAVKL